MIHPVSVSGLPGDTGQGQIPYYSVRFCLPAEMIPEFSSGLTAKRPMPM